MRADEFRSLLTSLVENATAGNVTATARLASAVESAFRDATAVKLTLPAGFHDCKDLWRDTMSKAPAVDDVDAKHRAEALRSFDRAYSQLTSAICEQVPPVLPRQGITELTRSLLLANAENPGEISSSSLTTREDRVNALVNSIASTVRDRDANGVIRVERLVNRAAELAWFCSTMPSDCIANAQRWEAVVMTGRVRVIGSAGIHDKIDPYGKPYNGYAHIGLELWTKHRADATYPGAISDIEAYAATAVQVRHDMLTTPERRTEFDYFVQSPCGRSYGFNREDVNDDYRHYLVTADKITGDAAQAVIDANPDCLDTWLHQQFGWPEILKYGVPLSDPDRGVLLSHLNRIRDDSTPNIESGKSTETAPAAE